MGKVTLLQLDLSVKASRLGFAGNGSTIKPDELGIQDESFSWEQLMIKEGLRF